MFGCNQAYSIFNNSNDSNFHSGFEEGTDAVLTPIMKKKSSLRHFDDKVPKMNRASFSENVVIVENIDKRFPHFNLKEGDVIEMIIFNEDTKEYEFTSRAVEV